MKKIKLTKEKILLSLILILSAILNFTNLSIEGYSNLYYAAGVKSMTMSLKNFFFVSFDPASFVTIDKPPLGFWLQAISAKIFGYSGWSILLPQALAGVISVFVIYKIVKRSFGRAAGLLSALFLATTPMFVAVSRNNTCDNLLVLTLLIACWFISIAAEKGKFKYLLISLAIVGVGFNIKMLQAYMVVPAIYLVYLLSSAISLKKRIIHLICGTLVLLVVSFSWAIVVDLIPAANRPYVGSSTNNSELELIIGHNGLERLGLGSSTTGGGMGKAKTQVKITEGSKTSTTATSNSAVKSTTSSASSNTNTQGGMQGGTPPTGTRPSGMPSGGKMPTGGKSGGGGGNSSMGGSAVSSVTRLFVTTGMSDQIIWLFPIAVLGLLASILKEKFKPAFNNKRKLDLLLWTMWLIPEFIYFSFTTGLFHPYYLTMLAAPITALAGIGIVSMWELFAESGWKSWILPVTLILDGALQLFVLSYFYSTSSITKILMIALSILCFVSSIILIILKLKKNNNLKLSKILVGTALIGLLITPTVWSATTLFGAESGTFPSAGLSLISSSKNGNAGMGMGMGSLSDSSNDKLTKFLLANKTTEKYLLVTSSASGIASDIIIKTGESVMTWGFFGTDKAITLAQFKVLVKSGEVRYVMIGGQGGGGGSTNDIMTWAKKAGTLVAESKCKDTTTTKAATATRKTAVTTAKTSNSMTQRFGGQTSEALYDLKGADTTK
ncbi:glycosyltransferase family 39 protein [Clostridium estertheticum]|uniref:glycosyltransferase family 39 protein n=1 Tax=Clostridium estertheticum TaxID=238834 RepID=UPI001C0DB009|nr:glycosyltransferase family 39 protein [Clostridium estertheticum]MBU3202262.1 glycosyltransferase family 39 protein [Clostridium estertheticum]WAG67694.1 glycosyltransferase family 39 protein [Clostridium estertheticum]